jgi:hypothetical protein
VRLPCVPTAVTLRWVARQATRLALGMVKLQLVVRRKPAGVAPYGDALEPLRPQALCPVRHRAPAPWVPYNLQALNPYSIYTLQALML